MLDCFQIKESPEGDWNYWGQGIQNNKAIVTFKLKNPRKGTETFARLLSLNAELNFQIKESPEGDWNQVDMVAVVGCSSFKLKNPRKGTETSFPKTDIHLPLNFQIKESPEGDWNRSTRFSYIMMGGAFKLKNPRKGTETLLPLLGLYGCFPPFKLKNPRKGTETSKLLPQPAAVNIFQIKESPEGDWNSSPVTSLSCWLILSN